jgi:hypothetical protein
LKFMVLVLRLVPLLSRREILDPAAWATFYSARAR